MPATTSLPTQRSRRCGAAALIVALLLTLAMLLLAAFTHRNLVLEQRSAAQQQRATQAFGATEAGLEWALARLNYDEPKKCAAKRTAVPRRFTSDISCAVP
jgi:Tfp pilus assembly protein PilX